MEVATNILNQNEVILSALSELQKENEMLRKQLQLSSQINSLNNSTISNLTTNIIKQRVSNKERDNHHQEIVDMLNQGLTVSDISERLNWSYQVTCKEVAYIQNNSEYKTNGIKKATKTEAIRSYDDYCLVRNYFLNKAEKFFVRGSVCNYRVFVRNATFWTVGIATGARGCDLIRFKFSDILNDDKTFKERIVIIERKTRKVQEYLITPVMVKAFSDYLNTLNWIYNPDDLIFDFNAQNAYKIIKEARLACGLKYTLGKHSMRKSFSNIILCVADINLSQDKMMVIQGLMNHSDVKTTFNYLSLRKAYDEARMVVSDFLLGKTDVKELNYDYVEKI